MAFDDVTPSQAQLVIKIIEALSSGHYKSEFIIVYRPMVGGLVHLYGNSGVTDLEIKDFSETDITALKEEGYLIIASRGKASLKPKAFKEYEKQNQPPNNPSSMTYEQHLQRLVKLVKAAGGSSSKLLVLTEVLVDEGLSDQEAWDEADYMVGEDWIKIVADNGPPLIQLTHSGIKAADLYMTSINSNQRQNAMGGKEDSISTSDNGAPIDIFISHSSLDIKIAEALIDLLKTALYLPAGQIRCTSVNGYKLQIGSDVNEQLRREIYDARVFIGVVTPESLASTYVLFELGARWGAKRPLLPVLALTDKSILKEPLKTLHAGCLYLTADVHELIGEVARQLGINADKVAAYEKHIKTLVRVSKPKAERKSKIVNSPSELANHSDVNTEPAAITPVDPVLSEAARLSNRDNYERWRSGWRHSEQGVGDASKELEKLFQELQRLAQSINAQNHTFEVLLTLDDKENGTLLIDGYGLSIHWSYGFYRVANSLDDTKLQLTTFKRGNILQREPKIFRSFEYDIDVDENRIVGWRDRTRNRKFLSTAEIANEAMTQLFKLYDEQTRRK